MYIAQNTGAYKNITTDQSSAYRQEAGIHQWYSQTSGSANAAITLAERMRIGSDGAITHTMTGQNTTSIDTTNSDGPITLFKNNGTTRGMIGNAEGIMNGGTGNFGIRTTADLLFSTGGGTERMRIDASGKVGIGTTPDAWKSTWSALDIGVSGSLYAQDNNTTGLANNLFFTGSAWTHKNTGATTFYQQSEGLHLFYSNASQAAGATFSPTERMRIDASGNVGIGNTIASSFHASANNLVIGSGASSDNTGLTIYSNANASGSIHFADSTTSADAYRGFIYYTHGSNKLGFGTNAVERFSISGTGTATFTPLSGETVVIARDSAGPYFGVSSNHSLRLITNNSTRVTLSNSGNVGIGTSNPGGKLHVQMAHTATDVTLANSNETLVLGNSGTGNGVYNAIKFGGNQQDMYIMSFNHNTAASRRMGFFLGSVAGDAVTDERLSILGNGNVGIGTSAPAELLDVGGGLIADPTIRIDSASGGDPRLIFDTGQANRSAVIKFHNQGSGAGGFIDYHHNGNKMNFGSGSSSGVTMTVNDGKVGIGTSSPDGTLEVVGSSAITSNPTGIGLATYTPHFTNGENGEVELTFQLIGTLSPNDTIVFTYEATSWKAWWFDITMASTDGLYVAKAGGYNNNGPGNNTVELAGASIASIAVTNSGQHVIVTTTVNGCTHPGFKIRFGCGGGEGHPKLSRCKIVVNS